MAYLIMPCGRQIVVRVVDVSNGSITLESRPNGDRMELRVSPPEAHQIAFNVLPKSKG